MVRDGEVATNASADPKVVGVRSFCDQLSKNPLLRTTAIQTVGIKGYDGFTISIVG